MKKLITTIVLSIIMVGLTNAQIKKPAVKVNAANIKTNAALQGVKVNDLSRLKTIADFEKLNIPSQQNMEELLNSKPNQTWRLSPIRLSDGFLKLVSFDGILTRNDFKYNEFNDRNNLPLKIAFRVTGGAKYLLKIKDILNVSPGDIFVLKNDEFITRIGKSDKQEYQYFFEEDRSGEITLSLSRIKGDELTKMWPMAFEEIKIYRLLIEE